VSSLLNLQSRTIKDEAAQEVFQESRARVRAMALVHEILYRSQDFARLNMREYAGKLIESLIGSYQGGSQVRFTSEICDCPLSVDTAVSLGLILNELVSNSFKHAFAGGRAGALTVSLVREAAGYCLTVADDGPGLPADYDPRKAESLGMQLVGTLTGQISGTVAVVPGKGARIQVRFPG
jgi:two-component sensor histidine kinase